MTEKHGTPEEHYGWLTCGRITTDKPAGKTAWDRKEHEPCQRGTVGCSVDHEGDEPCETW
jgi:hypothetical protein